MATNTSRREFIKKSLLTGGLAITTFQSQLILALSNQGTIKKFKHGVASGEPTHSSALLWTRVDVTKKDLLKKEVKVNWEVASDARFKTILQSGSVNTNQLKDFTMKVEVQGLDAGGTYYYRFKYGNTYSEPGRTKTLPKGSLEQLGIAVASCSNFPFGYFNAYEVIANDPSIDFVLHLGDYIYEYGADGWGAEEGLNNGRTHIPAHELVSLQDYRQRHAQYKSDKLSRMMHAAHPLIPTWDDHESANNPWINGAQNHQNDSEGEWSKRRTASIQAYYEWMPVKEPNQHQNAAELWRHFSFGDLASLTTLETRHTGRSQQIDYSEHLDNIKTKADRDQFMREVLGDKSRRMLSKDMLAFFEARMKESKTNQTWQLIGNQIPMARTHVPDVNGKLVSDKTEGYDAVADAYNRFNKLGRLDLPESLDSWDGYAAARQDFYETSRKAGVSDLLVLTGDTHSFWANKLRDNAGNSMGAELGTTGITSPASFQRYGTKVATQLDQLFTEHNSEIEWTNCQHRGFIKLLLKRDSVRADFVAVDKIDTRKYKVSIVNSINITKKNNKLDF